MSSDDLLVMHVLRIKGATPPVALADLTGLDPSAVDAVLATAVVFGHAVAKEGRQLTYRLTPEGKEAAAKLLREGTTPEDTAAAQALDKVFLPLNNDLKALTTDWQIRNGEPNDHTDAAYDAAVVARLAAVSDAIGAALPQPGGPLTRMSRYRPRFASALARVQAGELAAFARPMADSFHDAWMELHQDLLLTLDRQRDEADGH
ncbi:MAG: MarR family transcriptional regulator [Sporichthyaceae bacterium]